MSVSILICSCYMYRNLWQPFFKLKTRYFNDPSIPIYLGTDGPPDEVRSLIPDSVTLLSYSDRANNNTNYITRVVSYLRQITTQYVVFWYDDMFLSGPVDTNALRNALTLMKTDERVKIIKLSNCSSPFTGQIYKTAVGDYQRASPTDLYVLNVQPGVFDREFLLRVLEEVDMCSEKNGPSDFETHGTAIAQRLPYLYLKCLTDVIPVFSDGGVVRSGIVYPEARAFLEREQVHVKTYDKHCIYDLDNPSNTNTLNHQLKLELNMWFSINV